jgi:Rrf2 family protein
MPLLTRKVDYALLILSYLDQKVEGGCAREIALQFGLSRAFVANILKELLHKGFVTSHRGVKGGYILHKPADEVNLAELMDALDDTFRFAECTECQPGESCRLAPACPVHAGIIEVHRRLREMLRTVTLAELCRPNALQGSLQIGLEPLTMAGVR